MADRPQYMGAPRIGAASISTANTARDGTGTIATILTAGSNGTKIVETVDQATSDPADSIILKFLYDGSTYWFFLDVDIGNPAAASTTVGASRTSQLFDNLVLPSGWSWRGAITVALTAGVINSFALGGDF